MENLNKQIQELQAWTDCITNSTITRRRRF